MSLITDYKLKWNGISIGSNHISADILNNCPVEEEHGGTSSWHLKSD